MIKVDHAHAAIRAILKYPEVVLVFVRFNLILNSRRIPSFYQTSPMIRQLYTLNTGTKYKIWKV